MMPDCFDNTMQSQNIVAITFDTDWAPDWCIQVCFELCMQLNVTATFFMTNTSHILPILKDNKFELGIHPNFLLGSSHCYNQKKSKYLPSYKEVLEHCFQIVPDASSMRAHTLYRDSRLYVYIEEHVLSLKNDVSTFLPGHRGLQPVPIMFSHNGRSLLHFTCTWEDDIAILNPQKWLKPNFDNMVPGVYIFNFHPVHIVLNSCSPEQYTRLRQLCPIYEVTQKDCFRFMNTKAFGVRDFFEALVSSLEHEPLTIEAIGQEFRKKI